MFVQEQLAQGYVGLNFTSTLPVGTSIQGTLNTYQQPMYVTQIVPEIYYNGTLQLLNADAGIDKVTFNILNAAKAQAAPFNTAITMSQWYLSGLGNNFKGFMLPAQTSLTFTFTHTAVNWATASTTLDLSVAFIGIMADIETLKKYYVIEDN